MKIGVNLSINVKDIIKERLVSHANGKVYLNMTAFIDTDNQGQYGDNGMITHAKLQDEQGQMQILGNAKVFWREDSAPPQHSNTSAPAHRGAAPSRPNAPIVAPYANDEDPDSFDDLNIPF